MMKSMLKPGTKAWRYLTLALIAVPWFFRDHLAVTLEEHTQEAQQVLSALETEHLRQQQSSDQRDLRQSLMRIEVAASKAAGIISQKELRRLQAEMLQDVAAEEASALKDAAEAFNDLLKQADLEPATKATLADKAAGATQLANTLAGLRPVDTPEDAPLPELDDDAYEKAIQGLADAYHGLYEEAEAAREASASTAEASRFIAWVFTALGGLMLGGGTGLFGGIGARPDQTEAESASVEQA
jgi:hypothetical protein